MPLGPERKRCLVEQLSAKKIKKNTQKSKKLGELEFKGGVTWGSRMWESTYTVPDVGVPPLSLEKTPRPRALQMLGGGRRTSLAKEQR